VVVLSGGHTIGRARCVLSATSSVDPALASSLQALCPRWTPAPPTRSTTNHYFQNLLARKGLLSSDDQDVFSNAVAATKALVQAYGASNERFFCDFGRSLVKMGNISPLTGSAGPSITEL
jgi:peroxidase